MCVRCGAELGVGRFCLNCGHRIGDPAPLQAEEVPEPSAGPDEAPTSPFTPATSPPDRAPAPTGTAVSPAPSVPVQAADPTPVPPVPAPDPTSRWPRPAWLPSRRSARDEDGDDPVGEQDLDDAPPARDAEPAPGPEREPAATRWDPREELLPYEEVESLDSDVPIKGHGWIWWVAGAAVLVGVVMVLLRMVASEEDTLVGDPEASPGTSQQGDSQAPSAPGTAGETPTNGADVPEGVGKRSNLARQSTFTVPDTAPPTTDFDGNLAAYDAGQMGDGKPRTAWRMPGDATGETITITLPQPSVVTRVGLVNGYAKKVAQVDWYPNNRRILAVTWGFEDGSSVEQTFAERPRMQRQKVTPVLTSTVTITITSVSRPGGGPLGRDYTPISEVVVTGRPAA